MGVASSFAEFPLSALDGYSSGDDGSPDPSSGNDEPMTRVRDRQESADMMGPVDVMQSALSDIPIPSPSPADETSNKKSVSSEDDESSEPVPGIGVSKTRGRARHRNVKRGHRPLFIFNGTPESICVKHLVNRPKGRRKVMAAHHYRLKPGEGSTVPHWLRKKQPEFGVFLNLGPKYRQKGRKKVMVAHHYRLKPGEDMTCPLWLKHQYRINYCHRASFDLCWPKDPSITMANT